MGLEWTDDLKTGHDGIDEDHRQILDRIQAFQAAYHAGKGEETLVPLIQYLEGYIDQHFEEEERLMTVHRYPGLPFHRNVHEEFRESFSALSKRVRDEGAGVEVMTDLYFLLEQWFRVHISVFDMSMAKFLKTRLPD